MSGKVEIDLSQVPGKPLEKAYQKLRKKQELPKKEVRNLITEETDFSETTADTIIEEFDNKGYIESNGSDIKKIYIEKFQQQNQTENFEADDQYREDLNTQEQASFFADYLIEHRNIKPVKIGRGDEKTIQLWSMNEEKVWNRNGFDKVKTISKKELPRNIFGNRFLNELKTNLESSVPVKFKEMGVGKNRIALQNGLINLEELSIRDIQPNDYVLKKLAVSFEKKDLEEVSCPQWIKFLEESVPDEKQRKKLQEYVGYCLMHWTTKHEKALMLLGPTDSGKGVFLDTVETLLGEENVCNYDLQYLANKMWGRQDLATNIANIRHDLDTDMISKMGKAKEIISGNPIEAAKKGVDPVKVHPVAKHLYSANSPPERKIEDEAFYNRWLTVIFPDSVPKEEQDKELIEKLTGRTRNGEKSEKYEGELPGIFSWALVGYKRLRENSGEFTAEIDPAATQQLWQEYGSTVKNFKEEYMVKEEGSKVPTRAAYEAYKMFTELDGLEQEGHAGFTRQINEDPEVRKGSRKINGENWSWVEDIEEDDESRRCFVGIRLKSGAVENLKELTDGEQLW